MTSRRLTPTTANVNALAREVVRDVVRLRAHARDVEREHIERIDALRAELVYVIDRERQAREQMEKMRLYAAGLEEELSRLRAQVMP